MTNWNEQKDATRIVRWGQIEAEDDKDAVFLVKKNSDLIGKVKTLEILTLKDPMGNEVYKPSISMELDGKTDEFVRFICPSMLQTELGLNTKFMKERTVTVGDTVKITYLGKKKEKNMHLFKVAFAVD